MTRPIEMKISEKPRKNSKRFVLGRKSVAFAQTVVGQGFQPRGLRFVDDPGGNASAEVFRGHFRMLSTVRLPLV